VNQPHTRSASSETVSSLLVCVKAANDVGLCELFSRSSSRSRKAKLRLLSLSTWVRTKLNLLAWEKDRMVYKSPTDDRHQAGEN
jgi:hypothetical protein